MKTKAAILAFLCAGIAVGCGEDHAKKDNVPNPFPCHTNDPHDNCIPDDVLRANFSTYTGTAATPAPIITPHKKISAPAPKPDAVIPAKPLCRSGTGVACTYDGPKLDAVTPETTQNDKTWKGDNRGDLTTQQTNPLCTDQPSESDEGCKKGPDAKAKQ